MSEFKEYLKETLYQVDEVNKKTGEKRLGTRYRINPKDVPTAVIFGKFSPIHRGHLLMMNVAKEAGIKDIIYFSPAKDDSKESDANLFTNQEKDFLNNEILKSFGFTNVRALRGKEFNVPIQRNLVWLIENAGVNRPVVIAGTDREKEYSRWSVPFNPRLRKPGPDEKFEILIDHSRGDHGMSASAVREMIRNKDVKGLTSEPYLFKPKIAKMLIKMAQK